MGTRPLVVAAACVLLPTLALAGCGSGGTGSDSSAPATSTAPTASSAVTASPAASTGPLYENAAPFLTAAREEFGEIEVSVLFVHADEARIWFVNPSAPRRSTLGHQYRDGAWTDSTTVQHPTTGRTLSLDEIDPDTIRAAAANAPGALGLEPEEVEIEHVAVGTGETDEQEYVVSLTSDNGVGSVIFSPDLSVLETSGSR